MKKDVKEQKTIGGLRANALAFLVNLSAFIMGIGIIFSLIILIIEPNNEFVRKYSKQTLILSILGIVALPLNIIAIVGHILFLIIIIILIVLQILASIFSILGKEFFVPKIEIIENLLFVEE